MTKHLNQSKDRNLFLQLMLGLFFVLVVGLILVLDVALGFAVGVIIGLVFTNSPRRKGSNEGNSAARRLRRSRHTDLLLCVRIQTGQRQVQYHHRNIVATSIRPLLKSAETIPYKAKQLLLNTSVIM